MRSTRRIPAWKMLPGLLALSLLTSPTHANGPTGTVLLSQQCDYLLLDIGGSQALLKLLEGEAPQPGDRLRAEEALIPRDFNALTNLRTEERVRVWVDVVERSTTRALNRYGQYCK